MDEMDDHIRAIRQSIDDAKEAKTEWGTKLIVDVINEVMSIGNGHEWGQKPFTKRQKFLMGFAVAVMIDRFNLGPGR